MPDFVKQALEERGLMGDYRARPAYQQNDYIGWITRAKRQATKDRRLEQMLGGLETGGAYMNMPHTPSRKPGERAPRASGAIRAAARALAHQSTGRPGQPAGHAPMPPRAGLWRYR
jgi:hypothetical protein